MFKYEHNLLPTVFDNYFKKPTHQYSTRYASTLNNFEVLRTSSGKEKSLLKYYGPKGLGKHTTGHKKCTCLEGFHQSL